MKKFLTTLILIGIVFSCSSDEDDAPPPASIVKQYTLSVTAGQGGSVSTTGGTFSQGTEVSITATPSSGYSFSQWSNGSTTNPLTLTVNSNTNLTASFVAIVNSYTLTVSAGEGGTVSTEGGEYEEGTEVTITATPNEGYEFVGWEGSDSTEASLTVTIAANNTLNAVFVRIDFTTISERFSEINETTGYFKAQEYFTEYLSKSYTWDILSVPYDGHTHWHAFHKNSVILDFDGDGREDIVAFASSFCNDHVYSYHKGKFVIILDYKVNSTKLIYDSDLYFGSGKMEVNDFDNDGISDVLFFSTETKMNTYNEAEDVGGHTNIPPSAPLLLQFKNNDFITTPLGLPTDSHTGTSGDVDNDGDIDFIQWSVPGEVGGEDITINPTLLINNGNLNFTPVEIVTDFNGLGWYTTAIDLFDINNDGILDLIAGWYIGENLTGPTGHYKNDLMSPIILFGDGSGNYFKNNSLEIPESFLTSRGYMASILGYGFTDYDNDGDIDILVTTTRDEPGGNFTNGRYYDNYYLILYRNDNNSSYTDVTESDIIGSFNNDYSFPNFYHIRTIDVDDDGDYDILPDAIANWGNIQYGTELKWLNNSGVFIRQ